MRHLIRRIFRPASVVLYHVLMQLDHIGTVQRTASASHKSGVVARCTLCSFEQHTLFIVQ